MKKANYNYREISEKIPEKCEECLQYIHYCIFWEKNFNCERYEGEKLKQVLKEFFGKKRCKTYGRSRNRRWYRRRNNLLYT